jgi:glycosyltransferase involved in cell wall biosynthesis
VFGRIHPDKGAAEAIAIARATGRRLTICGIVQDAGYFTDQIEPHNDGDRVVYLGSVGPADRADVGSAAALLHPISFAEPFGLSVVEAMTCGTPVVAYRRGSMREVVDETVTAYLAGNVAEAVVAAVEPAVRLDRAAVRERATSRFGAGRMVDENLRAYRRALGG